MSRASGLDDLPLSESEARRVDRVCNRFEAAWKSGGQPRVEDFLAAEREMACSALLRELVLLEAYYRQAQGETCRPEEFQARFPALDGAWLAAKLAGVFSTYPGQTLSLAPPPSAARTAEIPFSAVPSSQEVRSLLHKRLRALGTVAALGWGLTWTHKFFRLEMRPDTLWLIMVPGGVFLAFLIVATVTVWLRQRWTLRQLRTLEVAACVITALFLLWENYFTLCLEGSTGGRMRLYANRDISEMATLARHTSIVWFMLIVFYGTLILSTWRRCAAVTGGLALTVLAVNAIGGLWNGAIELPYLGSYLAEMAIWLVMAVGGAIYGSHKISTLRQEAIEARKLGPYQLKRRLGAGGMGEVYLAEHVLLKQPCAVKLIRPERAGDPTNLRRFEREVQATARLKHWNTVQIFDYGHTPDGSFYYAMEYLPGLNLDDLVKHYGPLPAERALHLLRQVCAALGEAHAMGLIHRDIKPGNIIACERGGVPDVAKLLDFGLVRTAGLDSQTEKLTQEGAIAGTPAYMSPEQAAGQEELDARSDIYSLGAVAYFLLTGQAPFRRSQAIQVMFAHLHDHVRPMTELRTDIPADVESVVLRCLDKEPSRRYPDVQSLEKALASCRACGRWNEEDAATWWRRHRGSNDSTGSEGSLHQGQD